MTLARLTSTGRGSLKWRLSIEGLDTEAVSDPRMEITLVDGRVRRQGLEPSTIRFGGSADIMMGTISAESCTLRILDVAKVWTRVFGKRAQKIGYLNATTLAYSASTITDVVDTSLFPASGVLHLGTEAISYTGKTATTYTGCTRGIWGTKAQTHFTSDGAGVPRPRITEIAESSEGRRARLYAYGSGDSLVGDGSLVWQGVISKGASWSVGGDGAAWSVTIDPLTRILSQKIGSDLKDPVPIRGIYYTTWAPLVINIWNNQSHSYARIAHSGFAETPAAFCDQVTTEIAASIAASSGWTWSAGSSIAAVPTSYGWDLVYTVGNGAGLAASINLFHTTAGGRIGAAWQTGSDVDDFGDRQWLEDDGTGPDGSPVPLLVPVKGHVYRMPVVAVTPRATVGGHGRPRYTATPTDATASPRRVYLGGLVAPSATMSVTFQDGDTSSDDTTARVVAIDTTNRTIDVNCGFRTLGPDTRLRLGRWIAQGSVLDFINYLTGFSNQFCNSGAMPLVIGSDVFEFGTEVTDSVGRSRLGSGREFVFFDGQELGEVISNELRALGCYMRLNAGAIELAKIQTLVGNTGQWTIGEADVHGWPTLEQADLGMVSQVSYKTGYDPAEGEWRGATYRVRDVTSTSSNRTSVEIEIAQRSYPTSRHSTDDETPECTTDEVVHMAYPVLGLFGAIYDTITVQCGMRYLNAKIGDSVLLTSSKVPSFTGTRGVTSQLCMITGTSFDASTCMVTLAMIRHSSRFAGYVPDLKITGWTNIAGNVWELDLQLSPYTTATNVNAVFALNDAIRITERDTATPTQKTGTVTSFTSSTKLRVTLSAAWVPGASEWALGGLDVGSYNSGDPLGKYCFVGSTTAALAYADGAQSARVWAP